MKVWPDSTLKPRFDEFFADHPPVSPPLDVKVGGVEAEICFRALDRQLIEWLKWESWAQVLSDMKANNVPEKFIESTQGIDAVNNENQIRLLCSAMIDAKAWAEDKVIRPAFSLDILRKKALPDELSRIDDQWWIWQTNKTVGGITDEQQAALIEEAKKKSPDPMVLIDCGAGGLLSCISIMAGELEALRTAKFTDISFGDPDLIGPIPATSQADNNLQSLYTRLSASLDEKILEHTQDLQAEITHLQEKLEKLKG